jgi:hypothetical protein
MNDGIDVGEEIARYLSLHSDCGVLSLIELVNRISALATEPGFFNHIERLPPDVVDGLRRHGANAEAHPEDYVDGFMGLVDSMPTREEFEEMTRRGRARGYWVGRLLREHFFPGLPMPAFETMKLDGTVSDASLVDGAVVILGPPDHFIRSHPIHLVSPSGGSIVTSVIRRDLVPNPAVDVPDGLSGGRVGYFLAQLGRNGLFLDANVRSPAEVPPGTEVWVDRSDAGEVPPLSQARRR